MEIINEYLKELLAVVREGFSGVNARLDKLICTLDGNNPTPLKIDHSANESSEPEE